MKSYGTIQETTYTYTYARSIVCQGYCLTFTCSD